VSAIRLFILGTLAASGPLHGHQIRQHAQTDRTELWADVQPGSLYGALKRLAAEGLIHEVRTERQGNRPERTVYEITLEGHRSLSALHDEALNRIISPNDPFDLALALSRDLPEQNLEGVVTDRLTALRAQESVLRHRAERADPYVNEAERMIMQHVLERVAAEIRWHEELLARMPKVIADFNEGIGGVQQTGTSGTQPPATNTRKGSGTAPRAAGNSNVSSTRLPGTNEREDSR
jgi:DNA-binding PadR family transcriptional regulator